MRCVTVFNIVCRYNNSCRALSTVLWSVYRPIILKYYLLIAERVKIIRWMFLLLTAGELKEA